ncbi:pentapeptide repeat-containing protein [Iningainema tapete]|uniref:Pentapeptide repeat-containing protein n=1 Tax=Iningainema tapete BLCC-T55 TaxID=2748662 RepID=A0A8J6Y315_9CYAN|nr:pentapeptide repeat-containing protein [Iningainema tapete]MBD2778648.1 pentapeptide repeat-containing protein [Iningainema tapete BLCC-T55]
MPPDYSRQNLRGRNFRGKNLEGANFSGADIRSTDFTGAYLKGANFSHAKAGLEKRWAAFLVLVLWLISGLAGFLSSFIELLISHSWRSLNYSWIFLNLSDKNWISNQNSTNLIVVIVFFIVFIIIIRQGLNSVFAFPIVFAVAGILTVTLALALALALAFALGGTTDGAFALSAILRGTLDAAFGGVIYEVGDFTTTFASALGFAGAVTIAFAFAFALVFSVAGAFAVAGVLVLALTLALALVSAFAGNFVLAGGNSIFMGALPLLVILFTTYITWGLFKGDKKYTQIRNMAVAFAAFKGTSFRSADLTDANFTGATLKSTDFRKATLTCTSFHNTKKLDRVRPGSSYLQKAEVRNCLVTGLGQDKNFDRLDLRGINFKGANLVDASLISVDLSGANLQDADLSRAKLVQAQLDGTDFTGATLTGAYIQDWNITIDTKFNGVQCEYVYMRLPTKENADPLRKPDNNKEVFADGEFGDFIQPIFDTLDLYHNQGVDPRAIAVAFKELAENNPEVELEIVAVERRGEDKILLRVKTAATASKSELSREYFLNYNQIKELAEQEIKILIAEKENQVYRLENMVLTALERPNFYVETVQHQGDIVSQKSETSHYDLQESKFGGGFAGTGGNQTSGTFHENSSHQNLQQQPQTLIDNQIICANCKRPNPNTFNFCIKCGTKLTSLT